MKTPEEIRAKVLEMQRARGADAVRYRAVEIEIDKEEFAKRAATDGANALLPISLSSETPVKRYDWWEDEEYQEILDHTKSSIDLSRAGPGMPFLVDHNARDWKSHLGTIENVRVDASGKKLRGDVRFSARKDAQDLRGDMLDGIRPKISIGYQVDTKAATVTGGKPGDQPKVVRYMKWTPLEGSSVAIPADENVGVGRGFDGSWEPGDVRALRAAITEMQNTPTPAAGKAQERAVPEPTAVADPVAAPPVDLKVIRADERGKIKQVIDIYREHKDVLGATLDTRIAEAIEKETEPAAALAIVREAYAANLKKSIADPTVIDLSEADKKRYNLGRGIEVFTNRQEKNKRAETNSLEMEVSDELALRRPEGLKDMGGLLVPMCLDKNKARMHNAANESGLFLREHLLNAMIPVDPRTRTGLYTGSATVGGDLVFTVPGEFLEILRNFMACYAAGVSSLTGLQGPIAFPQQAGAASGSWVGENPGSDVAESNLTLGQVSLAPKTYQATTSYSRQLFRQSVIDVDGLVKTDLSAINALALDAAIIAGTGSSNQPTGILSTSGIATVALGTNGLTPTYNNLVDMETQITAANADQWPLSYMVHPTTRGTFKKAVPLSATNGLPVWTNNAQMGVGSAVQAGGGARQPGELNGYKAWASAQVPNNLTKGSSSGNCLAMIFGAFPTVVVGDWGMFEIIVDPFRLKKQGMIELTTFAMYGIAAKYPAALCAVKDALA